MQDWDVPLARARQGWARFAQRDGLSVRWQWIVVLVSLLLMFSREPILFLHAQFYAEDGSVWFKQAYEVGWLRSLALPEGGYLNTLQRLVSGVALLVPFRLAPLVMALGGLLMQVLPIPVLLSARCRNWGTLPTRCWMAALYVAIPNALEVHVVLTNAQWHLVVVAFLLLFSEAPRSLAGRAFDVLILLVSGFTGPFSIVLIPLTLVFWAVRRQGWTPVQAGVLSVGAMVQVWMLSHGLDRPHAVLGATGAKLVRLLGGNVAACALLGRHGFSWYMPFPLLVLAVLLLAWVYGLLLKQAPLAWKLLVAFTVLILAASLRSPLITGGQPLWDLLIHDVICRYWFFPILTFMWGLIWMAQHAAARRDRWVAIALLCGSLHGIRHDWIYWSYPDYGFPASAQRFEAAAPGTHIVIPIIPYGHTMELTKK